MMKRAEGYHVPVLLRESVEGLAIRGDGVYVDATFGGGGHSRGILRGLGGNGHLFCFDQDGDAEGNFVEDCRMTFVRSNFRYLKNWMRYYGVEGIDGLIADLGVSSHHLDDGGRGFSFRYEGPLDMRMNKRGGLTAADVVNGYDEGRIGDILYLYGELRNARRMAAAIVRARSRRRIVTTGDLLQIAGPLFPRGRGRRETAKLFQALRIEVNHEMDALSELLNGACDLLRPGGRLSVITYHSIEDRMVKRFMKGGDVVAVGNGVTVPSDEERARNPRSRSAKLRVGERVRRSEEDE